jgi:hypothetical protein
MEGQTYREVRKEFDFLLQTHMEDGAEKFALIQADIKQLRTDMRAFTDAWQQARGVVTFIKWIVSIAGGVTALFLFIKDHIK